MGLAEGSLGQLPGQTAGASVLSLLMRSVKSEHYKLVAFLTSSQIHYLLSDAESELRIIFIAASVV